MIFELLPQALERAGRNKRRGLELGRSFSKHAYATIRDAMEPDIIERAEAYWRATDAYIDGGCSRSQLLEASSAIPSIVTRGDGWIEGAMPPLTNALLALCLEFEELSAQRWDKWLRDLAKDAQLAVAEHAAQQAVEEPKKAYAAARWEEARWQLQHIIATEPNLAAR